MAFRVNKHFDAVALEYQIFRLDVVHKFKRVGHAGTAAGFHAQADALAFAAFAEEVVNVVGGVFCQGNHCLVLKIT